VTRFLRYNCFLRDGKVLDSIVSLEESLAKSRANINNISSLKMNNYMETLDDFQSKLRTLLTTNEAKMTSLIHHQKQETADVRSAIKDSNRKLENQHNELVAIQNQRMIREAEINAILERQKFLTELSLEELRTSRMDFRSKLGLLSSKHNDDIKDLRVYLLSAQSERYMLRNDVEAMKMELTLLPENLKCKSILSKQNSQFSALSFIHFFALLTFFIAFTYSSGLLLMDGLCAPVMPGTTLEIGSSIYSEAPWWWSQSKEQAFFVCGERRRTSLSWNRGRLLIIDMETQVPIIDKRMASVLIKNDSIHLYGKHSQIHAFRSPWTSIKY
jgi:hypothetical protein